MTIVERDSKREQLTLKLWAESGEDAIKKVQGLVQCVVNACDLPLTIKAEKL